jgi:predicted porin
MLAALATLAATASFAQNTVTISGVMDAGYRNVSAPLGGSTKGGFQNGTATSAILIQGTEDLGGGLTASFRYEINPDFVGGSGLSGSVLEDSTGAQVRTSNGANGYNFVAVGSKDIGTVRFGRLNTGSLSAWATASVFGTALGSGYGSNGNMYVGAASSLANFNQTAPTRYNGAVEYTTPTFSGFSARVLMVPKVDNTGAGNVNNAAAATLPGANRASVTDLSLAYNQGPLNVMVAQQAVKTGAVAVNGLVNTGAGSNVANGSYKLTTLAANYTMGAATVYAGYWTEKQATVAATATVVDAVGTMIGAKYTMGALTFMGSYGKRDDKSTANAGSGATTAFANADKKIMGLGVDYALSKRTNLWARYENRDGDTTRSGTNTANANASWDATKTTAVGVRHTF